MPSLKYLSGPAADVADADAYRSFRNCLPGNDLIRLFDYWLGLVQANGFAVKHRVDPVEIAYLLPAIYLEEWDRLTQQSRIRLAGESLKEYWGGNSYVGATVDEQTQGAVNALWKQCDKANFLDRAPTLCRYHLEHRDLGFRWIWDLSLPIADARDNGYVLGMVTPCGMEDGMDATHFSEGDVDEL